MDSRRVLYFLNFLNDHTTGHGEELSKLYTQALDENDDVSRMKFLYENCSFYGELGRTTSKNVEKLLKAVYSDVDKALEIISEIKIENEVILHEIERCDELMHSPYPFRDSVTVLRKKAVPGYIGALDSIASACIYLLIVYKGIESLASYSWDDSAGLREKLYTVNNRLLPAILELKRPGYYWVIKRKNLGGKALFGGSGYFLSYESAKQAKFMTKGYKTEPVGAHAYLNVNAFDEEANNVPLCWGTGYITSLTPANAIQAIGKHLVTDLKTPTKEHLAYKMPAPAVLMRTLSGRNHYCITADELVKAMNQWQTGHEIEVRRATGRCLFCGNVVKRGNLICPKHFEL